MNVLVFVVGLTVVVWMMALARYHSMALGCAIFFVLNCCFPAEFGSVQLGGLTLTLDRLWLLILGGQYAWDIYRGHSQPFRPLWDDLPLILFLGWLVFKTLTQSLAAQTPEQPSTVMHLINGYMIPFSIYWMLRTSRVTLGNQRAAYWVLLGLGVYLSLTALLEIGKCWGMVFPSFIGDPSLGIHFGRARGPMLQSVRLGIGLNLFLLCIWMWAMTNPSKGKWPYLVASLATPLALAGILATYTRSVWMGCGLIVLVLLGMMLKGRIRTAAVASLMGAGLVGGLILGPHLVAFKREYSEAETRESTYMRAAFAYVSIQMFKDKPITGYGFNQFQVYNRPYLADRSTDIRLESIRGYVHHNSYLSLLVDLGLIGLTLFILAVASKMRTCWQLWNDPEVGIQAQASCILFVGVAGCHAIQMAFHEVSFSSIEYTAVAISTGWMMAQSRKTIVESPSSPGPGFPASLDGSEEYQG